MWVNLTKGENEMNRMRAVFYLLTFCVAITSIITTIAVASDQTLFTNEEKVQGQAEKSYELILENDQIAIFDCQGSVTLTLSREQAENLALDGKKQLVDGESQAVETQLECGKRLDPDTDDRYVIPFTAQSDFVVKKYRDDRLANAVFVFIIGIVVTFSLAVIAES